MVLIIKIAKYNNYKGSFDHGIAKSIYKDTEMVEDSVILTYCRDCKAGVKTKKNANRPDLAFQFRHTEHKQRYA